MLASAFSMGLDSAIGTTINFFPKKIIEMRKLILDEKMKEAQQIQNQLSTAIGIILKDGEK